MAPDCTPGRALLLPPPHFTKKENAAKKSLVVYARSLVSALHTQQITGIINMCHHYPGV